MKGSLWEVSCMCHQIPGLQLECAKVLHEELLMLALLYGSEAMSWGEKERSRIRAG